MFTKLNAGTESSIVLRLTLWEIIMTFLIIHLLFSGVFQSKQHPRDVGRSTSNVPKIVQGRRVIRWTVSL
jgi:hypothetical protein